MKRMLDYTTAELMALSGEDQVTLVDLECAFEGVPLLPLHPGNPPEAPDVKPDKKVFRVNAELLYDNEEVAKLVTDFLASKTAVRSKYLKGYGGPMCVEVVEDPPSITTDAFWSHEHYDRHKAQVESHNVAKAEHDRHQSAYDDIEGQRNRVESSLHSRICDALEEHRSHEQIKADYERYLGLAGGDRHVAFRFFMDATKFDEDFVRKVLNFPLELDTPAEAVCPEGDDHGEESSL